MDLTPVTFTIDPIRVGLIDAFRATGRRTTRARVVSKVLRHSSIAITHSTYVHLLEGVGRAAAESGGDGSPQLQSARAARR